MPGVWYGADEPQTVAAELAHWRWQFFLDSEGLREEQVVTELTFFQARFSGLELDLTGEPWAVLRDDWRDPATHAACQRLAAAARERLPAIAAIRYESARREGGLCEVVFDPAGLSMPQPHLQQTWVCKTTRERVLLVHGSDRLEIGPAE